MLFASTPDELQKMLQKLSTATLKVGLTMNRLKTQVMTNGRKHKVTVDGQEKQYVDEYTYIFGPDSLLQESVGQRNYAPRRKCLEELTGL